MNGSRYTWPPVDKTLRGRWWTVVVPVLVVALIAVVALLELRARPYPFDDAFISFRYADNLARGRGLVYNPGERVEGYTNFLWTVLVAAGMALGGAPLTLAGLLGGASFIATIVLSALAVRRIVSRPRDLIGLCCLVWLVLPADYAPFARCGLETVFVAALIVAMGLVAHGGQEGVGVIRRRGLLAGSLYSLLPTALVLTRLDGAVFVVTSAAVTAVEIFLRDRPTHGARSALRGTALLILEHYALFAAVMVAWTVWKVAYYGDLLPNTYYAKAGDQWNWEAGLEYLDGFVRSYPHVLVLLTLSLIGAGAAPSVASRRFALWAVAALGVFAVYIVKVGGDFMHYRFAFEAYPLLVSAAGVGLVTLAQRTFVPALAVGVLVTVTAQGAPVMATRFSMQDLGTMRKFVEDGRRSGPRLKKALPANTIISTSLAGTIAYYSDLTTIDELGLNDRYVARLPGTLLARGHVKHAPDEYLVSRGVNLKLTHPWDVRCTRAKRKETKHLRPTSVPIVWLKIDKKACVRMDYIVQTPELTKWFCEHPNHFVTEDLECLPRASAKPREVIH
jgi:arabinofuranosyltransferase